MIDRGRIAFWLVVCGLAAILFWGSASTPLTDPDEARFARTSVEMIENADPVIPTFDGVPRLVKPPLLNWIQATLFRLLGPREIAARLPAILATVGCLLLVALVARRRFGEEGAAWAAALFSTLPLVIFEGKVGTIDALLTLHVFAVVAFDMVVTAAGGVYAGATIGALLGLAFLAKGPVGVILPLLAILAGRTATTREILPRARAALAGVCAWGLVVLPWSLAFVERLGFRVAFSTIRSEVLDRYFATTRHEEPYWYYAGVFLVGFFPWAAVFLVGMVRAIRRWGDPAARTATYATAGFLAGFVLLSVGRAKLPNYLLPLAPLAPIIASWEIGQELSARGRRPLGAWLTTASLGLGSAGLAAVVWVGKFAPYRRVILAGAILLGAGAVAAAVSLAQRCCRMVFGSAAAAGFLTTLLVVVVAYPALARSRTTEPLVRAVPELGSGRPVVVVERHLPSLSFYLDRVPESIPMEGVSRRLESSDRPLLVVVESDLGALPEAVRSRLREVGRSPGYVVLDAPAGDGAIKGQNPGAAGSAADSHQRPGRARDIA